MHLYIRISSSSAVGLSKGWATFSPSLANSPTPAPTQSCLARWAACKDSPASCCTGTYCYQQSQSYSQCLRPGAASLPFPRRARQSTPGHPSTQSCRGCDTAHYRAHAHARSGTHSRALACMHVRAHAALARRAGGQACRVRYIKYPGMRWHAFV